MRLFCFPLSIAPLLAVYGSLPAALVKADAPWPSTTRSTSASSSRTLNPPLQHARGTCTTTGQRRRKLHGANQDLFHQLRGGGESDSQKMWGKDRKEDFDSKLYDGEDMQNEGRDSLFYSVVPGRTLPLALSVKGGDDMAMRSFQWASFRNRTITAILLMAFLGFLSYYFKEDGLTVFTVLLQGMMFQEMTQVIGGTFSNPFQKWWWFVAATIAWNGPKIMPWRTNFFQAVSYGMTVLSMVGTTLQLNWQKKKASAFREYIRQAAVVAVSSILVVLPASFWIGTLEEFGMVWIFVPALYMIINDTMAYVGGQLIGKHPLLPSISPKKTWEGFIVAALSTIGVAYWLGSEKNQFFKSVESFKVWYPLDKMDGMILAAFTSLVSPFGGFIASIIKRAYGQKDFGNILPGHGGLVDRLDCQLFLAPAVYLFLTLYKFAKDPTAGAL